MSEEKFIQIDLFGENDICISKFIKSPLNYTGNKYELLSQIYPKLPKDFNTFVDCFGGGFDVGSNVNCKKVIYNDIMTKVKRVLEYIYNHDYETIVNQIESIIKDFVLSDSYHNGYEMYGATNHLGLSRYNKESYLNLRNYYNSIKEDCEEKDLLLLVLIMYSFNYQIRYNKNGEFNMPVGKYDFNEGVRTNLRNFSNNIHKKDITFLSGSYDDIPYESLDKPFFYCDPPYLISTAPYNENRGEGAGWDEDDEVKLLNWLSELNSKGYKFALSNVIEHKGKTNTILKEWVEKNNFKMYELCKNYRNANYQVKDRNCLTREVLITNYTFPID